MSDPTKLEREALLELLLDLGGPLCWTGPIPYDALAARHSMAEREELAAHRETLAGDGTVPQQAQPVDRVRTVAA